MVVVVVVMMMKLLLLLLLLLMMMMTPYPSLVAGTRGEALRLRRRVSVSGQSAARITSRHSSNVSPSRGVPFTVITWSCRCTTHPTVTRERYT
jgi:hypothetical protein